MATGCHPQTPCLSPGDVQAASGTSGCSGRPQCPHLLWVGSHCREVLTHPNWVSFAQDQSPSAAGECPLPCGPGRACVHHTDTKPPEMCPNWTQHQLFHWDLLLLAALASLCWNVLQAESSKFIASAVLGLFSFSPSVIPLLQQKYPFLFRGMYFFLV